MPSSMSGSLSKMDSRHCALSFEVDISATVVGLIFSISTLLHPSFHSPRCGFPQQIYSCAFKRNMLPINMHQCRIQPLENTNKEFQVVDTLQRERCQILNDYSPVMYNCVCSDETLGLSHQQPFKRLFIHPDVQCCRLRADTYLHKCLENFKFKEVTHL